MFGWFLVIVLVVAVFSAHKFPAWKEDLKDLSAKGSEALKKGKEAAEKKIAEVQKNKKKK